MTGHRSRVGRPARRWSLLGLALAALLLAGCASVPGDSTVQVLRKVTEGERPALPPGPGDNTNPLDLVRGFVNASGSTDNRHAAARRFLAPQAQGWEDNQSLTVLADQFDTVYARPPVDRDRAVVRVRGTQLGVRAPDGSFQQAGTAVEMDVSVAREHGQWRIDGAPAGTLVRLSDFQANFRPTPVYFMDPVSHAPVPDLRYLPAGPARTLPSEAMDALLAGPSEALAGAVATAIPRTSRLRSNVTDGADGAVIVDLTELGGLDTDPRRMAAAQVMLTLSEINVPRVRLLADGAPILPETPIVTRDSFPDLVSPDDPRVDVAGLVVVAGRAHTLGPRGLGNPVPGPAGAGAYDLVSATGSADGQRLAVVDRSGPRELLTGRPGGALTPTGLRAATLTRPTWMPSGTEVWTARNGEQVVRLVLDPSGRAGEAPVDDSALTALGPIGDLRLSRDGMRIAAVVGGRLAVAAVARSPSGIALVRNVRVLAPTKLSDLAAVDWRSPDQIAVVGRRPGVAVALVSVDGLDLHPLPTNNLTLPLSSIATGPGRPLLVTDQNGLWSFGADDLGSWRQLVGAPTSVAGYPS